MFDQDIDSHREKEVDIEFVISATETIIYNDPGILVLIVSDRDYRSLINEH